MIDSYHILLESISNSNQIAHINLSESINDIYIYIYIDTYTHVRIYIYMYTYIHVHMYIYICVYVYMRVYIYTYNFISDKVSSPNVINFKIFSLSLNINMKSINY